MAAPTADVQVGDDRWTVTARELDAGAERDECWALATTAYAGYDSYQTFTDRTIPVAVLTRQTSDSNVQPPFDTNKGHST